MRASAAAKAQVPAAPAPADPPASGGMTGTVRAELVRLGQAESIPGALALRLAQTLDDPRLSNAQVPSLINQLQKILEPLLRAAPPEADDLDEFTARMIDRQRSA